MPFHPLLILTTLLSLLNPIFSNDAVPLLVFKAFITSDPTNIFSSWAPSTSHCHWPGVTCSSRSAHVTSLNLTDYHLAGTLPSSLANLTQLRSISLPNNFFSGFIPPEIAELTRLEILELQSNNLSGTIPTELSKATSLLRINLSRNMLAGEIPSGLVGGGEVRVLDLSNNQLSGKIDLSQVDCKNLEYLKLSNNFLVGALPRSVGKCVQLRTLLLDGNILEGSIPVEVGEMTGLRVLDLSRNSLTDEIPKEIGKCKELSVIVLTNLDEYSGDDIDKSLDIFRGEYNAFVGGVPEEVFMIPALRVLWAPRANIGGRLSRSWTVGCALRVLNLGQNYMDGVVPEELGLCRNLTFLDLSSNRFSGSFPLQVQLPCMVYLNVSRNFLSGVLKASGSRGCGGGRDLDFLDGEDVREAYSSVSVWYRQMNSRDVAVTGNGMTINHDFSWNKFTGLLPVFSLSNELLVSYGNMSYALMLNENGFDGSLPAKLFDCSNFRSFSLNLTANKISSELYPTLLQNCLELTRFEAAHNHIWGSISSVIGTLIRLSYLDLRENRLSGYLPDQLGDLKNMKWILLGGNNFTGEIPSRLGRLTLLEVLDLSENNFRGSIPTTLANAHNLEILLLDHNVLTGEIPASFSSLADLMELDVSYNNLSGHIPKLHHIHDCESFKGNRFLHSCPDPYSVSPAGLPYPLEVHKFGKRNKMKSLIIPTAISVSVVFVVILVIVLGLTFGRKKLSRLTRLRRKVVVTFADTPIELSYQNVVSTTGNFSIRNLIGTGGFGSTYKAELVPGYLVAVKRLSLGRFQGIQQFEAEIKTLGRVRHKNLVTLIGYYVGDTEMFLIYNYLSGGNLETFIQDRSARNVKWAAIYKITVDVAHALAYLHYSCVPRIVHRDIKPSNILLDEELNAYLSDFGLARLLEVSQTHATTDVAGTFGYVAPEYATTCRVSDKADVYSFGVVLLELMSGKKCLDPSFSEYGNGFNIVGWATMLMEEDRCSEFFFTDLWEAGPEEKLVKMLRLALSCTVEALVIRPSMKQVLEKLKQLGT